MLLQSVTCYSSVNEFIIFDYYENVTIMIIVEFLGETRIIRIIIVLIIIRSGIPLVSHSFKFNWKPKCIDPKVQYILDSSYSGRNY